MGDPAQPTPAERIKRRAMARTIIECVRNDEPMRLGLSVGRGPGGGGRIVALADVEELAFALAQEVEMLRADLGSTAKSVTDYFDALAEVDALTAGGPGWRHATKYLGLCRSEVDERIAAATEVAR
jgi:hypothetical protein